jgi:hypothetical protein
VEPLDESPCSSPDHSEESAQLCMFLSKVVVLGVESPRSMTLLGQIQGYNVLMLVDAGSSHMFISTMMASQL